MSSAGCSLQLTVVPGERKIEAAGVISVAPAILPEASVYNTAEPSEWGRDLRAKRQYRSATTAF